MPDGAPMALQQDAAGGTVSRTELRGKDDDAVCELQSARCALAARKSLDGLLGVGVDGHRLGAEAPGVVRRSAERFEARRELCGLKVRLHCAGE
eukprot:13974414-Alexandrium_andersonii.AAC.1